MATTSDIVRLKRRHLRPYIGFGPPDAVAAYYFFTIFITVIREAPDA